MGLSLQRRKHKQDANYVRYQPPVNRDLRQAGGILINKGPRVPGFKGSRGDYFVFKFFTGTLEPWNP